MARTERTPLPAVIQEARQRGEKWCRSCRFFQPFADFGTDVSRSDRLRDHCKEADREKGRRRYAAAAGDTYRPMGACALRPTASDWETGRIISPLRPTPTRGRRKPPPQTTLSPPQPEAIDATKAAVDESYFNVAMMSGPVGVGGLGGSAGWLGSIIRSFSPPSPQTTRDP
jgi:hypothetical protein